MITDTLKAIADTKNKLADLEKKAAAEIQKQLVNLHKDVGYESRAELIAALKGLDGVVPAKRGRKPNAEKAAAAGEKPAKAAKAPKAPKAEKAAKAPGKKRAKRARITDEMKAQIIEAVNAGAKGKDIAKQFGISVPSLQNIKRDAGLIKTRG